eukprot:2981056-Prymnesium_polylepis.1
MGTLRPMDFCVITYASRRKSTSSQSEKTLRTPRGWGEALREEGARGGRAHALGSGLVHSQEQKQHTRWARGSCKSSSRWGDVSLVFARGGTAQDMHAARA